MHSARVQAAIDDMRRAAERSARRNAKKPRALVEKSEWVAGRTLLHRIGDKSLIIDRRGGWKDSFLWGPREPMRTRCGRRIRLYPVGIFDRLDGKRCDHCCDAMGITRGYGCPINDKTVRLVKP